MGNIDPGTNGVSNESKDAGEGKVRVEREAEALSRDANISTSADADGANASARDNGPGEASLLVIMTSGRVLLSQYHFENDRSCSLQASSQLSILQQLR